MTLRASAQVSTDTPIDDRAADDKEIDMNDIPTMTDYESLRFMLLLPFSMEGGDAAEYDISEIETVLKFAKDIDARAEAAEATIDAIRTALDGYPDSDLVSLATTLNARSEALEAENVRLQDELASTLARLIGCDGDEGRDTSEAVERWEAIMGDKWQGN